jgi:LysM repeat protein
MKQRLILIAVGLLAVLAVIRTVVGRPGTGDEVAVDTTGATSRRAGTPTTTGAAAKGQATGPVSAATATALAALATPSGPTPTPLVVQIQGTSIAVERKPLVLLNPSTVRQGSSLGVTGSGFDPGGTVDVVVKQQATDQGEAITFVQVDKSGGFGGVTFAVPDTLPRGSFIVEARQRNSDKVARATAVIAGGSPQVKLGTQAGKAGDTVELSAQGFGGEEDIKVFWNAVTGDAVATLRTDGSGAVRQGSIRVPFGAVGNNGFIFVGDKSQSPLTVPFQLLNLYPDVTLNSYAIKPDNVLSFTGKDFGPNEVVTVYLNSPDGQPLEAIQANADGSFENAGGFLVPFGLHGKQTLIFVGQQSKAPTTASFDTLPYTPSAQPSTYGGRPGTTLTFYAVGFARNEIVHAVIGRTRESAGNEVSCFRTDAAGNAASAGSYMVPGDAQAGQLIFTLIGSKSEASATAALEVIASEVPVQVAQQSEFRCDLTDEPVGAPVVGATPLPVVAPEAAAAPAPAPAADAVSAATAPVAPAPVAATAAPAPAEPTGAPAANAQASPTAKAAATAKPSATAQAAGTAKATATPKSGATATSPPASKPSPTAKPNAAAPATPTGGTAQAAPTGGAATPTTYTIADGDTLPSISQKVYGDANQWRRIYDANKDTIGSNPNLIKVGAKLTIPPKESP